MMIKRKKWMDRNVEGRKNRSKMRWKWSNNVEK